jgi:hypothetical protein
MYGHTCWCTVVSVFFLEVVVGLPPASSRLTVVVFSSVLREHSLLTIVQPYGRPCVSPVGVVPQVGLFKEAPTGRDPLRATLS